MSRPAARERDYPTCATCPFWAYAACRRYPPVDATTHERWPRVGADHWCGEHPDMPAWIAAKKEPTGG